MFKKLFVIFFLFQTLATSAWGAVGVSTLTPSEKVEMTMMHQLMHMDLMTMTAMKNLSVSSASPQTINQPEVMQCDQCCPNDCHSLLCASIHVTPLYNLTADFQLTLQPLQSNSVIPVNEALTSTTIEPELPPPNTPSV